jgi:hypothetical protein
MSKTDTINVELKVESVLKIVGCLEGYDLSFDEKISILAELDKYVNTIYNAEEDFIL